MENPDYIFYYMEKLEQIVDSQIETSSLIQMKMRNGMTRELYIHFSILNSFLNENNRKFNVDEHGIVTEEDMPKCTEICAKHYGIPSQVLIKNYRKVWGDDFLDSKYKKQNQKPFSS